MRFAISLVVVRSMRPTSKVNGNARFLRELCVGSWIMRNDVNKKLTWNQCMESFVNCVCYILMFKILLTVVLCNRCIVMIMNLYSLLETFWNYYTGLYGINASIMQRQARLPSRRVLIVCPTHCNSSRLYLFVAIFVQI